MKEDVFTSVLVTEVAEVSGAGYCNHLSEAGWRPTGDDIPHALATCQEKTIPLTLHCSNCDRQTWTHMTQLNNVLTWPPWHIRCFAVTARFNKTNININDLAAALFNFNSEIYIDMYIVNLVQNSDHSSTSSNKIEFFKCCKHFYHVR